MKPSNLIKSIHLSKESKAKMILAMKRGADEVWRYFQSAPGDILLSDARTWIGVSSRHNCSVANFKRTFLTKNPTFEPAVHYKFSKSQVYLTFEGFTLWIMRQTTMIARIIQSKFAEKIAKSPESPLKSRKRKAPESPTVKVPPSRIPFTTPTQAIENRARNFVYSDDDMLGLMDKLDDENRENTIVFFIQEEGDNTCFKIGITAKDVKERIAQLQTGNRRPLKIYRSIACSDHRRLETYLHDIFDSRQTHGEWYNIAADEVDPLVKFIAS